MNIPLKAIAFAVASSMTLFATGCTHTKREYVPVPTPAPQQQPSVTIVQPPAAPHEEMPPAPAETGYSWVPGHYERDDGRWKWEAGHWVAGTLRPMPPTVAESPPMQAGPHGNVWIPGYWAVDHGDWVWVKGHWEV